jgi:uncharacterized protein
VTAFGAFVDVGVHQDGLVHISQLADRFVSDPNQVVKVAQRVEVTVLEVDLERKRISLSMKGDATKDKKDAAAKAPAGKGPQDHRGPDKSRQDRQTQDKKKSEPAPFNNPFARAFGKKGDRK